MENDSEQSKQYIKMTQTPIPKLVIQLGMLITILGLLFRTPFMRLLGSTETILPYASTYAFYILLAAPIMCSSCVFNNVLRFEGHAAFSMWGLAFGGFLNIFGDWLLMRRLHMVY